MIELRLSTMLIASAVRTPSTSPISIFGRCHKTRKVDDLAAITLGRREVADKETKIWDLEHPRFRRRPPTPLALCLLQRLSADLSSPHARKINSEASYAQIINSTHTKHGVCPYNTRHFDHRSMPLSHTTVCWGRSRTERCLC